MVIPTRKAIGIVIGKGSNGKDRDGNRGSPVHRKVWRHSAVQSLAKAAW
jgi:hypothetical protein